MASSPASSLLPASRGAAGVFGELPLIGLLLLAQDGLLRLLRLLESRVRAKPRTCLWRLEAHLSLSLCGIGPGPNSAASNLGVGCGIVDTRGVPTSPTLATGRRDVRMQIEPS
jgi:hypothetical protein